MTSLLLSPFTLYFGKMLLISAILSGYYWLFLRNASFHPYNRWYLLGSVVLSLILPFLYFPSPADWMSGAHYTRLLAAGGTGGVTDAGVSATPHPAPPERLYGWLESGRALPLLYSLVSTLFLVSVLRSLYYLLRISGKYPSTTIEGIRFFQTGEPGTPFSFLNRLFWNKDLDLASEQGQFIFRHEWYHIRQRHSADILALTLIRSLFWFNPFFYWVLRECRVVHEFLADRYALSGKPGDPSAAIASGSALTPDRYNYAEWLVWQSVRTTNQGLAHSFFHTHLKRRINMITQFNQLHPRYISRVMVLPIVLLLFCFFAAKAPAAGQSSDTSARDMSSTPPPFTATPVWRHYLHNLRYPQAALDQQKEGTIWFSLKIGNHNQLLEYKQYDAAPQKKWANTITINVTSKPSDHPSRVFSPEAWKDAFLSDAKRASEKISTDTAHLAPGKYFITVNYKIERPKGKD